MKRKLLYLFGLILLATGLFAGCMVSLDSPEGTAPGTGQEKDAGKEDIDHTKEIDDTEKTDDIEKSDDIESINDTEEGKDPENSDEAGNIGDTEEMEKAEKRDESDEINEADGTEKEDKDIQETGEYTSKEEVAEYLYLFGHLPANFITKKEAKALGWVSKEGNLGDVAPGKSIGGDYFGNYEGNLPEKKGRSYYECDIDSDGGYRGSKRIVYSDDGLIYYTEDHYENFELLYGEE